MSSSDRTGYPRGRKSSPHASKRTLPAGTTAALPRLDDATTALLATADRRVPARQATQEIDAQRMRSDLMYGAALSYEVIYDVDAGFGYLSGTVAPRLVAYLHQKELSPLRARGVFVSLFVEAWLYFIEVPTFLEAIRKAERWSQETFAQKIATWAQSQ